MPVKYRQPNRGRRSGPATISAPTGGLNGRDNYTTMDPRDAFVLDNWFPSGTDVQTRGGSLDYATELGAAVESIEVYTGGEGSKMLAFAGGEIFDVTVGGVAGAALETGRTSNRVTSAMFANAGAQFLLIFSGEDVPLSYDGTTLADLAITGLNAGTTQDDIAFGMAFKGRMFLGQNEQLGFYYLGIGAIQGAASYFDLSQQSLRGGYLAAMVAFSGDGEGIGPQDYALFVTSEGEYLMYEGTDPSNAATWALVGRFFGPPPIGKKGWVKFRSDVYFITEEGILSFSQIRQTGEGAQDAEYITAKLGRLFTDATTYQSTHGWCGLIYPRGNMLIANLPMGGSVTGAYAQYVMNTNTNAWCRFQSLNGLCWATMDRLMYFGTADGRVVLADTGFTDNGTPVQAVCRQAWNTFDDGDGMGEADKQYHLATFAMQADGAPSVAATLNVNFEDVRPEYATALEPAEGAAWDEVDWDAAEWAGSATTTNITIPIGKVGYISSLWMQATSTAARIRWFATRVLFERLKGTLLQ